MCAQLATSPRSLTTLQHRPVTSQRQALQWLLLDEEDAAEQLGVETRNALAPPPGATLAPDSLITRSQFVFGVLLQHATWECLEPQGRLLHPPTLTFVWTKARLWWTPRTFLMSRRRTLAMGGATSLAALA